MSEERFDPWARRRARRLLLQALYQWQVSGTDAAEIERQFAEDHNFKRIDRGFFHEVLRGVIAEHDRLDALIAPHLDRQVQALDQVELVLLRMGAYELHARPEVPFKVAINEAVTLARDFGAEDSHKLHQRCTRQDCPQRTSRWK
jgi:transcription antitermination protein NusB